MLEEIIEEKRHKKVSAKLGKTIKGMVSHNK